MPDAVCEFNNYIDSKTALLTFEVGNAVFQTRDRGPARFTIKKSLIKISQIGFGFPAYCNVISPVRQHDNRRAGDTVVI